jgi:LAS superfamily LD-carboxypeptidase LdcB
LNGCRWAALTLPSNRRARYYLRRETRSAAILNLSGARLTGHDPSCLAVWDHCGDLCQLHPDVIGPLQDLCGRAAVAGLALRVASGFRSFERQLAIWNAKARGERPVLDDQGRPHDLSVLSDRERMYAILRWSALPGASRHHWGTDIDVWDAAAVATDYRPRLVADEYAPGGPFFALHSWLTRELRTGTEFFRPYATDTGGVAPEPWHLSFAPVAREFEALLSLPVLRSVVAAAEIDLKTVILEDLDTIHARFVESARCIPPGDAG